MTPYKKSLLYTILFSLLITIFAAYDIRAGYNKEVFTSRMIAQRETTFSYILSECHTCHHSWHNSSEVSVKACLD